jgi:ribonuclease BN (tRNA processing enzyme)
MRLVLSVLCSVLLALAWPAGADQSECGAEGVAVQVLGSGGPELADNRAASSYLLWQDGRARVLIDIGGGSAARFGAAGGSVAALDLILLTHLHVDHSGDLPALVKSSYFGSRRDDLPVFGPVGRGDFPSTTDFLHRLFGPNGAFAYLGEYLPSDGQPGQGGYALRPANIHPPEGQLAVAYDAGGLKVYAARLGHGIVPALGWRIEAGGRSVAFSGDTHGDDEVLVRLAADADLLVAHHAVPESAAGGARALHMPPSVIGRVAGRASVRALLLSHRMRRTLGREAEARAQIARHYDGPVTLADDLACIALQSQPDTR